MQLLLENSKKKSHLHSFIYTRMYILQSILWDGRIKIKFFVVMFQIFFL